LSSQDGMYMTKALGRAILASFKKAGYKPYEQIDDFYVVESKVDSTVGVTVDFREEMTDDSSKCIVQFFKED
jgi:hypothetical protein